VRAARKQNLGKDDYFEMRLPATSERVRMYCGDEIAKSAVSMIVDSSSSLEAFQPQGTY
jgi:hypothetical protein